MRARKSKKKLPNLLWRLLKRYLANSSIHGVRYLVEDGRHWTERLFWLISCALSWWGCAILISGVLSAFENRRTAVTVGTNYLDWPAELPSIHLCAMGTPDSRKYATTTWKSLTGVSNKLLNDRNMGYEVTLPKPHDTETFERFAEAMKLNCSNLFWDCEWDGNEIDCCEAFRPLSTPIGSCLSINSIYTTHSGSTKGDYENRTFTIRRTRMDSLRVRFQKTDYWKKISKDLTIYVLGNTEIPTPSTSHDKKFTNKWKTSKMVKIDVMQQPTYNEDGVHDVPVEKRGCRFIDENENSIIYRLYGYDACATEKYLKRMYDICGCIGHLFPRAPSMPVCNQTQLKCVYESFELIYNGQNEECIADCELTLYDFFQNYSNETTKEGASFNLNLLPGPTLRYHRYVVHSKLEVVVSVGSALGLFVGASILSLVEIPYWFIVRSIDDNDDDDDDDIVNEDLKIYD